MRDPLEGLAEDGTIVTGAARHRIPAAFAPVLADVVDAVGPGVALYVYGSVATGQARLGASDVDIVALGMEPADASELSRTLSARHADIARDVAIGAWVPEDLGDDDAGHGNRVFLKHYCVWLSGPDPAAALPRFRGDAAAARGFNGDFAAVLGRWRTALSDAGPGFPDATSALARRVGRKTLFSVASMVSVHDCTWTTDRVTAAARWGHLHPGLTPDLGLLVAWGDGSTPAAPRVLARMLDTTVPTLAQQFEDLVGMWRPAGKLDA
ncbi:nucleotidyltransferase domain-containing protein [Luteococcus sp. OSA5]|uniref:nucleotidyltransferase domain-containing protein n=1 Tax=Luteococcus sp. OSA5 TaxID=3401630 RepID=UPI003B430787